MHESVPPPRSSIHSVAMRGWSATVTGSRFAEARARSRQRRRGTPKFAGPSRRYSRRSWAPGCVRAVIAASARGAASGSTQRRRQRGLGVRRAPGDRSNPGGFGGSPSARRDISGLRFTAGTVRARSAPSRTLHSDSSRSIEMQRPLMQLAAWRRGFSVAMSDERGPLVGSYAIANALGLGFLLLVHLAPPAVVGESPLATSVPITVRE